jgi:hypothetical protein
MELTSINWTLTIWIIVAPILLIYIVYNVIK